MIIRRVIKVMKRQNGLPSRQQGEETCQGKVNMAAVNAKHNPKNNPITNANPKYKAVRDKNNAKNNPKYNPITNANPKYKALREEPFRPQEHFNVTTFFTSTFFPSTSSTTTTGLFRGFASIAQRTISVKTP